jgi:Ca2+-binding RTX toxin-like protein
MPIRMRARGRRTAIAPLLAMAALAVPTAAWADSTVVQVAPNKFTAGQLRVDGIAGAPSMVEVSYRTAAEAGSESDRFVVEDAGGVLPLGEHCAVIDATHVSCDARPVTSIVAALGDGDDVMVVNAGKGDGVPARYTAELNGQKGADVLRGGLADDLLRGEKGRDVVAGWSGDDDLFGGPGADGLIGFTGDDRLVGGKGRDALFGQKGRDLMFGGPQNDVLLARDGFRDPKLVCGPGKRQRAVTDHRDPRPRRCVEPKPKG